MLAAFLPVVAVLAISSLPATVESEHLGTLDSTLTPGRAIGPMTCLPATPVDRARLSVVSRAGRIWSCVSSCHSLTPPPLRRTLVLLVERRRADPVLYVDVDHDGGLSEAERYDLSRSGEVVVRVPLAGRAYPDYPVAFSYSWPGLKPRNKPERRVILQSLQVFIEGTVPIDRTGVRVRYTVSEDLKPSQYGWIGIDGDGNGTIDENSLSPESVYRRPDRKSVLRVGGRYFSTVNVDPDRREVRLREHRADEYRRIELVTGRTIPDFEYLDDAGRSRRLSELRGQFVLLNFWDSWCPGAVRDLYFLEQAHRRYGQRGLHVVGFPNDPDPLKVQTALTGYRVSWPNASPASARELAVSRFFIASSPVPVLLDPAGRIVSTGGEGELPLRGKGLLKTLKKIVKRSPGVAQTARPRF